MTFGGDVLGRALDRAVPRVDAWRGAPIGVASEGASYKEWMHWCVRLPGEAGGHLLVNLNVTEAGAPSFRRRPRLIVLAERAGWSGLVEDFADDAVVGSAGTLDLAMGRNSLRWQRGAFRLSLETSDIAAELTLRPLVLPTVPTRVSLGEGRSIHWVAIPRLEAHGWARVGAERMKLEGTTAYHDHNWGHFRWGGDLSWEWGFVNASALDDARSAVLVRVSDRGGHRVLGQSLLLWEGDSLTRTFQDRELRIALEGTDLGPRAFTVPPLASLLVPGTSAGVPASLTAVGTRGGDVLGFTFETASRARVAIPSDVDPFRLVLLNETSGRARVEGVIEGQPVAFEGAGIMEFVRG
jgi:hypothetical protein